MNAQVEELKSSLEKQAQEDAAEIAAEDAQEKTDAGSSVVNDVSSLVKPKMASESGDKKRKAEEVTEENDEESLKKTKTDEQQ